MEADPELAGVDFEIAGRPSVFRAGEHHLRVPLDFFYQFLASPELLVARSAGAIDYQSRRWGSLPYPLCNRR
jgi:hypothetical protein